MKILHVTYAPVNSCADPLTWLNYLDFYTGTLDEMSKHHIVESIHLISYSGALRKENVLYHFLRVTPLGSIFPFRLNSLIRERKPDVIVVHGFMFSWQLVWLVVWLNRGIRIFVQHHAETTFRFPKNFVQKIIDRRIRGYFFTSNDLATPWVAGGQIRGTGKIHEVLELSSPFYSVEKDPFKPDEKSYLWVGRLDDNKDPVTLVRAFIKFLQTDPTASLHMVFRGGLLLDDIQKILARAANSQRIILHGAVDRLQMPHWYSKSSFILSTSQHESAGAAVCEGMSCGCIPILTSIPPFRMMTANGEVGLLFDPGNVDDLAGALRQSTSINISRERQRVLDHFKSNLSFEAIAKKMLNVIERG